MNLRFDLAQEGSQHGRPIIRQRARQGCIEVEMRSCHPVQQTELAPSVRRRGVPFVQLPTNWVTMTHCTKRARISMRHLLQMILEGGIRTIGRTKGESGFNALRFDIEEIRLRAS